MRQFVMLALVVLSSLPAASANGTDKTDKELFQGEWTYDSLEFDGEKAAPDMLKDLRIRFVDDRVTIVQNDQVLARANQKLDPSKSPKTVDASYTEGPNKGKTFAGIYKIDGDRITACFATNDKDRPAEFSSPAGSGRRLIVLKRAKS